MNELPRAEFIEKILLLFKVRKRYRVEGDSMMPKLKPREQILVDERAEIKQGDIIIARHPFKKSVVMVKRVKEIDDDGKYFLISENLDVSSDSRSFGAIPAEYIKGKVTSRLI